MSTRPILKSSVPEIHKALCYFESTATNPARDARVAEIADVLRTRTPPSRARPQTGEKKGKKE
jgi:hypothetical protein